MKFPANGDKAGGDGRGEHRVEKHPGDAAGGEKGVGLNAHAVVDGQQPVPVKAHDLAQQGDQHDHADGFGRVI